VNVSKAKLRARLLFSVVVVVALWLVSWFAARLLIVRAPLEHPEIIVVLSGSATLHERAQHAAKLFSIYQPQQVILTNDNQQGGWSVADQRNPFFYEQTRRELIQSGVPADRVAVLYTPVSSTWSEASVVSQYVKGKDIHRILIVTSSYHSRRALSTFRTILPSNIFVGLDPVETGIQTPSAATWCFHRRGWEIVLPEFVKLIYYLPSFARNA
jgi:uncharacterized SAM-binding protein YcdF (DUF218 family)